MILSSLIIQSHWTMHCGKSERIRSFSGPFFLVFRLNMENYRVNLSVQPLWRKRPTAKTSNTKTFLAVMVDTVKPV